MTTLGSGIVSYWKMSEFSSGASGVTRLDSVNGNHLTDNGTTASRAGIVDRALDLVTSDTTYLIINDASASGLSTSGSFTCTGWARFDSVAAVQDIVVKYDFSVNQREYYLRYDPGPQRFQLRLSSNGTDVTLIAADNFGSATTNTWYFFAFGYDSVAGSGFIKINDQNTDRGAHSALHEGTSDFVIGAILDSARHMDGAADELGFWQRALTESELSELYNSGNANQYDFTITEVVSEIRPGGGGDYVSLSAWEADRRGNIAGRNNIEVARCFAGDVGEVTIDTTNWTADSQRFIKIEADASARHNGTFDKTGIAYIQSSGATAGIECRVQYTQVSGMLFDGDGTGDHIELISGSPAVNNVTINQCIFNDRQRAVNLNLAGGNNLIKNCSIHDTNNAIFSNGATAEAIIYNCTLFATTDGCFEVDNGGTIIEDNNYLHANSARYLTTNGTISSGTATATSNSEALTASLRNIPFSTSTFIDPSGSNRDFHLVAGSPLINKGNDLSSSPTAARGVIRDIDIQIRAIPYDIGADQFVAEGNSLWLLT